MSRTWWSKGSRRNGAAKKVVIRSRLVVLPTLPFPSFGRFGPPRGGRRLSLRVLVGILVPREVRVRRRRPVKLTLKVIDEEPGWISRHQIASVSGVTRSRGGAAGSPRALSISNAPRSRMRETGQQGGEGDLVVDLELGRKLINEFVDAQDARRRSPSPTHRVRGNSESGLGCASITECCPTFHFRQRETLWPAEKNGAPCNHQSLLSNSSAWLLMQS